VAASLLTAIGLPELIAPDLREYERLAVQLARQPEELGGLRARLAANLKTWPLFDTPRLTRNLERAYRAMWEIYAAGAPPRTIVVTDPAE
jgi:protein O-GlcNAc transferase